MGAFGMQELIVIFLIVLLIFGAKKLPEVGKGMGKAIKNFKGAVADKDDDDSNEAAKEGTPSKSDQSATDQSATDDSGKNDKA